MRIVYTSFRGLFSDSPRAIYEALVARGDHVQHTWLTSAVAEGAFPVDVETIPFGSPESTAALEAADVVVSNDHVPLDWEKRPDAFYLQTWHGTPLKRIHNDVLWAPEGRLAYLEHDIARWDVMLSPNAYSTARFRQAFGFPRPIHETGYPRNDLLSSPRRNRVRAEVRAQLGIDDGKTVVLYTPTWRDDLVFEGKAERDFEFPVDLAAFTERLGEDHVLLLRLHNMVSDRLESIAGLPVRDVSNHPDIRDLYLAADLLVTDYSSTMFDFAVTGKPILLFTYDLADYRDRLRGFYVDIEEIAPGPLLATGDELLDAIADLDAVSAAHAERYARFRETFTSLEDGHATDRVLDLFFPPGGSPAGAVATTRGGDPRAHR
ncbi:CDP-glycerol:poly(glycerophosphate) glycerophosphotransferase [Geodermatophilus telluris]|uniref:CDP-glycerol:poly(Glycerophosphate) glycerophosphotransferase n=1 Tax=Geodermatophilus telluris TaxID=1190417 RepID=A0A1G6MS99_9ACTN|nr:CDP-glycerol glycerophosphotransferase family protein [Geodermatophilus telluris]SDC57846.1 CDP-glycerol:poly(glycerophosphate) glycerophosphotransferase [Geodermatophilus telluris]